MPWIAAISNLLPYWPAFLSHCSSMNALSGATGFAASRSSGVEGSARMTRNTTAFPSELDSCSSLKRELIEQLNVYVGVSVNEAEARHWLQAIGLVVRNRIAARWHDANRQIKASAA